MHPFFKNFFNKQYILRDLKDEKNLRRLAHILLCNLIRLFFLMQCGFLVYYAYGIQNKFDCMAAFIPVLIIIIDGLYVAIFRHGKEYAW